ncbi:MAG: 5'-nucleotidase domain-containing protein [Elusimicrobia bacterium]|nr:MAG: 5'-nucleotidase domain-containing protein [Elusimicrobiota bacterium]KAF0154858.1 MAG: 5'-nucleotidase domain-containing protein [Elusimicrobiota bacterium]
MKKIIAAALVFCLAPVSYAGTVAVYHTSDVHGWYSARPAKWNKEDPSRLIGGFPALAALLKKEKNPYLLLDGGDMFQGTPEGNFTRGMTTVELMNALGYDAAVVGNHDYDYTEDSLRTMISSSSFTMLGANVYVRDTGERTDYLKPYKIFEKGGKKIAVLGLAGEHTVTSTLPLNVKHLEFRDEKAETARWMEEIRPLKPDAVVVLTHFGLCGRMSSRKVDVSTWTAGALEKHCGKGGTLAVARAAEGIDVVLGGHNHTGLLKGYYDEKSSTLLSESFYGLTDVTRVELDFDDKTGKFKGAKAELVPLWTDESSQDEDVKKIIAAFSAEVDKEMDRKLGEAAADLGYSLEGLDSAVGNWMTDAMKAHVKADIAFQNTAGIRSEIKKGPVRMREIYQVMPFENTLVTVTMTGAQLEKLLRDNIRGGKAGLQVSGLKVSFKPGKGGEIRLERGGRAVKTGDKFKVVTNNYLTTGGTGGAVFTEGEALTDTMVPVRDALIAYVKSAGTVSAPADAGRIVRLDD